MNMVYIPNQVKILFRPCQWKEALHWLTDRIPGPLGLSRNFWPQQWLPYSRECQHFCHCLKGLQLLLLLDALDRPSTKSVTFPQFVHKFPYQCGHSSFVVARQRQHLRFASRRCQSSRRWRTLFNQGPPLIMAIILELRRSWRIRSCQIIRGIFRHFIGWHFRWNQIIGILNSQWLWTWTIR